MELNEGSLSHVPHILDAGVKMTFEQLCTDGSNERLVGL